MDRRSVAVEMVAGGELGLLHNDVSGQDAASAVTTRSVRTCALCTERIEEGVREGLCWLYAATGGLRPLMRAAGGSCQVTPQCSRRRTVRSDSAGPWWISSIPTRRSPSSGSRTANASAITRAQIAPTVSQAIRINCVTAVWSPRRSARRPDPQRHG